MLGLADSISIGQHVDGAILTVLRDHSEVRKVYQAVELLKSMGIRLMGTVVNGVPIKADRRIAQMHKKAGKKPRKIAVEKASAKTTASTATKTKANKASAKVEKPAAEVEDIVDDMVDDVKDGISDGLNDLGLNDDVEIDFDDFDLGDKS